MEMNQEIFENIKEHSLILLGNGLLGQSLHELIEIYKNQKYITLKNLLDIKKIIDYMYEECGILEFKNDQYDLIKKFIKLRIIFLMMI